MNKELEALDNVKDYIIYKAQSYEQTLEDLETIKSALERQEKLENAWGIVKEKKVSFYCLYLAKDYKEYNELHKLVLNDDLTETEFNLLKEMLEEK